ncbi:relaxase/mobilization nuclease domain-containing protein [Acetobacter cerevisiae]|uniref:relaxase/mobilization nuclease domain-containing protein n=1 Tax=Acetobacter cerevisiae TaxID=178900 RepID=UPI0020A1AEF9|nr:hypothetical protein [Acetobacter cerevisiae]MCP1270626.1 hypothetical protein [Acetobacter cerevisiae]MCP1278580.1 hypothetical protein [Acetobacter cerevisiae]
MIIKGGHILTTSGHNDTASHIFEGPKNEQIIALQGTPTDMAGMVRDATEAGHKYGFHHFKIASKEAMTREQALEIIKGSLCPEYQQDMRNLVVVEHVKPRAGNQGHNTHYHIIMPHTDPVTGKALNVRNSYKRNEKISRLAELQLGHELVKGRHNKAVFFQLEKEGKTAEAKAIESITKGDLPDASFSTNTQRKAERAGVNVADEKQRISDMWKQSDSMKAFASAVSDAGLSLKEGDKKDTYIIEKDGVFVGSANRLTKTKKGDFARLYNGYEKEIRDVRLDEKREEPAKTKAGLIKKTRSKEPDEYKDIAEADNFAEYQAKRASETEARDATSNILRSEESEQRDRTDFGFDADIAGRTKPNRADIGSSSADSEEPRTADARNVSNAQNAIATAKINRLKSINLHDISSVRLVDANYITEIKSRLKKIKTDDAEYFSGVYQNLKAQNREVYKYNKQVDSDAIALIIDAICRLLFGYTIRQQKAHPLPISYPHIESPVDKATFDAMKPRDRRSIVWRAVVSFRASFEKHQRFNVKFGFPQEFADFQGFLRAYEGDWMAEEMANMYPDIYIKELEQSENEAERATAKELRKLESGQPSTYTTHTPSDLKMCIAPMHGEIAESIRLEAENKKLDESLRQQLEEWNSMQEQMRPRQTERENNVIQFRR